jgi:hypothetical protein
MCAPHWRKVPSRIKGNVYTWIGTDSKAYLAAREAAIKSVTGGQS